MTQEFIDISTEELEQLIHRAEEAATHGFSLSIEDTWLVVTALISFMTLQVELASNEATLNKLRKLAGIVKSSEKMSSLFGHNNKTSDEPPKERPKTEKTEKEKPTVKAQPKPKVIEHKLTEQKAGDLCPECGKGKLYSFKAATFLRVVGQPPFTLEQHEMERLRCNACGKYFTASVPDEVLDDGAKGQKYGYSACSIMALNKFFAGAPYFRQESMQGFMGITLSASAIFDQTEQVANCVKPIYSYLFKAASNADKYYLDDTNNKILDAEPIEKPQRNSKSKKTRKRTGVYSSGVVAVLKEGQEIVLYQTNIGHAGEFIDELLAQRDKSRAPPLLMTDALSSNNPSTNYKVQRCLCNSHGRRGFADLHHLYPKEVEQVLEWYATIWKNDKEARKKELNATERLAWHKKHSLPMMEQIRDWGLSVLETKEVEENSSLGKAINYMINHYEGLTAFCRLEGAPLDNNRIEQALKLVIRNRKNALFFKSQIGATVGDIITSLIATSATVEGINLFEYFNTLQRKQNEVRANPELYLPWNYTSQL